VPYRKNELKWRKYFHSLCLPLDAEKTSTSQLRMSFFRILAKMAAVMMSFYLFFLMIQTMALEGMSSFFLFF
jgi:hypothetical protein